VYNFIKKINNYKTNRIKQPIIIDNKSVTDKKMIAGKFNSFYAKEHKLNNYSRKNQKTTKREMNRSKQINKTNTKERLFSENVTIEELEEAMNKTKTKKQAGPDKIVPEFIKHLGPLMKKKLLEFYNNVWEGNYSIPADWKKAVVILILKPSKPAEEISSYRPISLTTVFAKGMERMVMARWYLETRQLRTPKQAGFRPELSKSHQMIKFTQSVKEAFNNKESILAVFVDFQGAYDKVWHSKLIWKLQKVGVASKMLHWIKSLTSQRWIATKYNNHLSTYLQTTTGLLQGAVSSMTLFNNYINDLPAELKTDRNVKCPVFANNVAIWTTVKNSAKNHREQLQRTMDNAIKRLCTWTQKNNMEISMPKTYQYFSLRHKCETFNLTINNSQITKTNCTK
jgi:hypothetical protein